MRRFSFLQIMMLMSIGVSLSLCGSKKPSVPSVTILPKVVSHEIEIRIGVPQNHHAYLDKGDEGVLLPIEFAWKDFTAEPVLKESPSGERDSIAKAMVLRGIGLFRFEVTENVSGKSVRIRTQICDDAKGICYPPAFEDVSL